jgi:hypothetical protein
MPRTTLRIGPHLNGWGIEERGDWRGPYLSREMAVQIATADVKRRRSAGLEPQLVVLGEDGSVLLKWPEPRAELADVVALEPGSSASQRNVARAKPVPPLGLPACETGGMRGCARVSTAMLRSASGSSTAIPKSTAAENLDSARFRLRRINQLGSPCLSREWEMGAFHASDRNHGLPPSGQRHRDREPSRRRARAAGFVSR